MAAVNEQAASQVSRSAVEDPERRGDVLPLREATRTWFAISLQTFGGPAGQIAVMQRMLVEERRWISQQRFLFALSYCTLLPGPEAQQLATYIGWLLNGMRGALVAGGLFILPGVLALLGLSALYVGFGDTDAVQALFTGVAPAVIAIVVQAVLRVGKRSLTSPELVTLAVASFVALAVFGVPFPAVVATAALIGWGLGHWQQRNPAPAAKKAAVDTGPPPLIADDALHEEPPSRRRSLTVLAVGLLLWAAPVALAWLALGGDSVLVDQGRFF